MTRDRNCKTGAIPLSLGYSPCPNDTFIFYGLVHGRVKMDGIVLEQPVLEDVETLNLWALQTKLQVSKLSFHALGHVLDDYVMLGAGAALGRGCGPLLVAGDQSADRDIAQWTIAVPGRYTTAAMLLGLWRPNLARTVVVRFDRIMEQVSQGRVDAGVIIHESRFTYPEFGLHCVMDLGQWWEEKTGLPIPLGCIAARRNLPVDVLERLEQGIRESVRWSMAHPESCSQYIHEHAQEMAPDVLRSHIALYVNDYTVDLQEEGRMAVETLLRMGQEASLFPASTLSATWK